jgi:hypothetical protein
MSKIDLEDITMNEIIKCAKKVFCNGIYVPSNYHPCGWDFISFDNIDELSQGKYDANYIFNNYDICQGVYDEHEYEDCTLRDILEQTNGKMAFELSTIDW